MKYSSTSSTARHSDFNTLLEALRAEVSVRQRVLNTSDSASLQRRLEHALEGVELSRVISAHWPLHGTNLPARLITVVRKVTRQYLRWYINPIVEQQNAYNTEAAHMLRLLVDSCINLNTQLETLQQGDNPVPPTLPPPDHIATPALQEVVRERAAHEPPALFPDLELRAHSRQLSFHEHVSAHWPLTGITVSERGFALVHKVVRRYLRWYINPIVEQQNAANSALSAAILTCMNLDAERRGQIAAKRARAARESLPLS